MFFLYFCGVSFWEEHLEEWPNKLGTIMMQNILERFHFSSYFLLVDKCTLFSFKDGRRESTQCLWSCYSYYYTQAMVLCYRLSMSYCHFLPFADQSNCLFQPKRLGPALLKHYLIYSCPYTHDKKWRKEDSFIRRFKSSLSIMAFYIAFGSLHMGKI